MNLELVATVAMIAPDRPSSRKLYVETLGLPLQGEGRRLPAQRAGRGPQIVRDLAALPGRAGVVRNRPVANGAAGPACQHRV